MVVLWIGVPLAVAGLYIGYSELQKSSTSEDEKGKHKNNAMLLGAGSALLGIASIWGNLASAEGPLAKMRGDDSSELVATDEMPTAAECDARRGQIQTYGEVKAACERMTAGGAGASLAANACMSEEVRLLRNCGIDIEQSPF